MSKIKIILIAVLALIGFTIALVITVLVGGRGAASQRDAGQEALAGAGGVGSGSALPLAVASLKPDEKVVEELARELRRKIDKYNRLLAQFEQREKRIRIAEEQLKRQAQELENLRIRLVAPLTSLKEAQASLAQSRVVIEQQEKENLKRMATVYEKMDAAAGSRILMGMCASGQEDDAAKILYYMSQRSAAKLLGEMSDEKLAAKLCEKMKRIKESG